MSDSATPIRRDEEAGRRKGGREGWREGGGRKKGGREGGREGGLEEQIDSPQLHCLSVSQLSSHTRLPAVGGKEGGRQGRREGGTHRSYIASHCHSCLHTPDFPL